MASILDFFKKKIEPIKAKVFVGGSNNYISEFGEDYYKMDTARQAIERITAQMAKIDPRHIRRDNINRVITHVKDDIDYVLHMPNEYMTTADFIKKQIWGLYKHDNYFIFPKWRINSNGTRTLEGLYPIETNNIEILEGVESGETYVKFRYRGGYEGVLLYDEMIHLRRNFTEHELMGGNRTGKADRTGLAETCNIQNKILNGVSKQANAAQFAGIIDTDAFLDDEAFMKMRDDFLRRLNNGDNAFIFNDGKTKYTPINSDGKFTDAETTKFLNQKILYDFGVSLPIWGADFTSDQLSAFYEITIEPLIISLNQAYSKTLLTDTERQHGNEIMFYYNRLQDSDINTKKEIIEKVGGRGAMSNDEIRELLGMPPIGGEIGAKHMQSLNYIDIKDAPQYQQSKLTNNTKTNNNLEGGNNGEENKQ